MSLDEDGVAVTRATAGPFEIEDLAFPSHHRIAPFDPDEAYLGVLLEGAMTKAFASRTHDLGAASVVTIPLDGRHGTDFSGAGCRVLVVCARRRRMVPRPTRFRTKGNPRPVDGW